MSFGDSLSKSKVELLSSEASLIGLLMTFSLGFHLYISLS